jgi:hypothetical protein
MTAPVQVRVVHCTLHGPMAWDAASRVYRCGLGGACMDSIPAAELEPYWALTDDEIRLTPPRRD